MARTGFGQFAGNFLQAFTQARAAKEKREDDKKERDAKMKLFDLQMKREQAAAAQVEEQAQARRQLLERLGGGAYGHLGGGVIDESGAMGGNAPHGGVGPVRAPMQQRPMSLTELLADPQNAMLMLRSGMVKPDDLITQENNRASRAMVERLMGGGAGAPGGFEMSGFKLGPNGQMMPDFALPQVTTQTVNTEQGPRIKTFQTRTGREVADLGEAAPDRITPEQGGRIQALQQAQSIVPKLRSAYIVDGKVNRAAVLTGWGNIPFTKGRTLRAQLEDALDAVIRARTGAAVTKEELASTLRQFEPHPLDDDATIIDKVGRLEQFVSGTIDVTTLPPRIRQQMNQGARTAPSSGWSIEPVK